MSEGLTGNDMLATAVNTTLSSANPGIFNATGVIGDNPTLLPADEDQDVDLASFQLNANDQVTINLSASLVGGAQTLVQLLNGAGVAIASSSFSNDNNQLDRQIQFTVPTTDTYYVSVSGLPNIDPFSASGSSGNSEGTYSLSIEVGAIPALTELLFNASGISNGSGNPLALAPGITAYNNIGDTNTPRLQGYTLVVDDSINNSSQNGILVSAGRGRTAAIRFPVQRPCCRCSTPKAWSPA